jgi:signal transduction histidine kinase
MGSAERATGVGTASPAKGQLRARELAVVQEIANAFLSASRGLEVYRLALMRLTPMVGASFSSVFLRDDADPELLRLECAHNWPQSSARHLGQMRIRVGRGATGIAVAERRPVEASDVFADPSLRDWWEPAREIGFRSMISLPLAAGDVPVGAVSFYYAEVHRFSEDERHVLEVLAAQLAATSLRAQLIEDLRDSNVRLQRQNRALLQRIGAAERVERAKDEFAANMSHELRTPLNSILGYATLLVDGQVGPLTAEQAQLVARIDAAGQALLRLINALLELSQLKLDRAPAQLADEDAVVLARQAVQQTGGPAHGVSFALHPAESAIPLTTDGDKVARILANLLDNAFKFTAAGEVELIVRRAAEDHVEWQVRDTGIGMRAEDQAAAFDEFRQVDGTSTRLYGGTGLGLALSRRLAELLGGTITVESEPGVGSAFTLRLPVAPAG